MTKNQKTVAIYDKILQKDGKRVRKRGSFMEQSKKDYYVIDLLHIVKTLWNKFWVIILSAIIAATAGFSLARFFIPNKYSSSIMLYVNNSSFSLGNTDFSISSSDLTAAQSLVKTYTIILKNRTTLEMVMDETETEFNYTYEELYDMIDASDVDETEILRVTVTAEDPRHAEEIVNTIAEVLPRRISEIIEGATMEVVDMGIVNEEKVSPSITNYTIVGGILGILASVVVLAIMAMLDDAIHDEEYIQQSYDYPILAKIPDLLGDGTSGYYRGYYSRRKYYQQDSKDAK